MRLIVFKSSEYLGVFEKGQYCPVSAKSLSLLKENAISEVYRSCAFLEKKLPNDSDVVEIIKTIQVKSLDEVFIGKNFEFITKKDYENLVSALYQTAFSYKIMVENFEQIDVKQLFSFVLLQDIDDDEQIMSLIFKIIKKAKILELSSGYAYLLKVYYTLTSLAKNFYYSKKELNKNVSNLFYFGV